MLKKESQKIPVGRYIDPLTDFGFKLLFGSEPHKDLLIDFLNELFIGRKIIIDLMYTKEEQQGPQTSFRKSIFDLTCTGQDGEQFIIEVQRVYQHFFKDRAIYYTSSLIHGQGPKGKKGWDFKLKEVYLIALMDFAFDDSAPELYLHRVHLANEATGKLFYEKLGYVFIELPKFNKTERELETGLDRWLYVLKNMAKLKKIPVFLTKRIFQKLFDIAEVSNLTKEQYMNYEKSRMAKWDEYAILQTAKEQGKAENQAEVVKNLIQKMGLSNEQVADIAGVTIDFVKKIRQGLGQ
jgi:predicted transposase/invertase (TIGR01784 family)